jgi:hypothetical protein
MYTDTCFDAMQVTDTGKPSSDPLRRDRRLEVSKEIEG